MNAKFAILLALPLLLVAGTATGQSANPLEVEFGYQWLDVDGNEDMYRTQVNQREGLLLRSLRFSTRDFGGESDVIDHLRVTATNLGTSPSGGIHIEAAKSDLWNLRLGYRQADAFSAHPWFANPFAAAGVIPGQHTYDRTRRFFDADLQLRPGRSISPFIGFSTGSFDGPGTTTYALGQDEFLLTSGLRESEQEIRGGVAFNTRYFDGVVTQGWRSLDSTENLSLAPGAGAGNNPNPILGRPVTAETFSRSSTLDVSTPFTNAYVTTRLGSRVRLIGNYSRFSADADGQELESATGSFVSFARSRFFNGLDETISSRSKNQTWRGGARAEVALWNNIDLIAGWRTEQRELNGSALLNSLFRDSTNFSGVDRRDVQEIISADSSLDRDEDVAEIGFVARALGPFTLRATFSQTDQDVTVTPDLEEIVIDDGQTQRGTFDRRIRTFDVSGAYNLAGFTLGVALRRDDADESILRTDYLDRNRLRLRAAYAFPGNRVRIGATAEQIDQENNRPDVSYDSELRQYSADVEFAPIERVRLRGAWSRFDGTSSALILRPMNFAIERWTHVEDGKSLDAGVSLLFAPFSVDADYNTFENKGNIPFDLDRYRVRVVWDFLTRLGFAAEVGRDKYSESLFALSDYEADRYGLFVRWRQ
ncbi:MAG TPA: porin [Thermoanaerobaculia bacterium]